MSMDKKVILTLFVILTFLTACQKSSVSNAEVGNNGTSADIGEIQTEMKSDDLDNDPETQPNVEATVTENVQTSSKPMQSVQYSDAFSSADGTVQFTMEIDDEVLDVPMPEVLVAPHFLTAEDARRIAGVLFGEADFYEAEPRFAPIYSKEDIQEKLARWEPYAGDPSVDAYIQEYSTLQETAPLENPHTPCQWEFKKESFYYEVEEDVLKSDISDENDNIRASVKVDGIPYIYDVATRNRSDFKLNNIYAYPYDGMSSLSIDQQIFQRQLCETDEPDEDTIATIQKKAETMLTQMEMGEWVVDECYVETVDFSDNLGYAIHVNAVPAFQGVPATRIPQLTSLRNTSEEASNYYLSDVHFAFSANGELVDFSLYSPVDVKQVINESVAVLPMTEIMQIAKNLFTRTDYYEYDRLKLLDVTQEKLSCQVSIGHISYGLSRIKVPETDESYYYVPAVTFYGNIQYTGNETGNVYSIDAPYEWGFPLLSLNAVDGTVVNSANR